MKQRVLLHIVFWVVYLTFKTIQNIGSTLGKPDTSTETDGLSILFLSQLSILIVKIPLVYSLFYLIKKYLSGNWNLIKTIAAGIALFIISFPIYIIVRKYIVFDIIYKIDTKLSVAFNFISIFSIFLNLFFVSSLAMVIKLMRENMRQKENEKEILKTKLETELRFLKAQTNPHFLFNTLNNIYALARKKSEDTADVVMKLSKLLRFMLYESQKTSIAIIEEIQVLENYIELEKIRYTNKLKLSFHKEVDNNNQLIAPLILLPLVENAFKHGVSENRWDSIIDISLKLNAGVLSFSIINTIAKDSPKSESEHIGLNNVQRQLELLYPEHLFSAKKDNDMFTVILEIKLSENAKV